jgi:hypothetical protein
LSGYSWQISDKGVLEELGENAEIIKDKIKEKYPPNASGFARILPWNWTTEPILPSEKLEESYSWIEKISTISSRPSFFSKTKADKSENKKHIDLLKSITDSVLISDLEQGFSNLYSKYDKFDNYNLLYLSSGWIIFISMLFLLGYFIFLWISFYFIEGDYNRYFLGIVWYGSFFFGDSAGFSSNFFYEKILFISPVIIVFCLFLIVKYIPWTRNQFIHIADEFIYPDLSYRYRH